MQDRRTSDSKAEQDGAGILTAIPRCRRMVNRLQIFRVKMDQKPTSAIYYGFAEFTIYNNGKFLLGDFFREIVNNAHIDAVLGRRGSNFANCLRGKGRMSV